MWDGEVEEDRENEGYELDKVEEEDEEESTEGERRRCERRRHMTEG